MSADVSPANFDAAAALKAFHGHLGPYVVAGLRMGRCALRELQAGPHFGVEADVYCPDSPPPSCAIDGIQFSTGCTLGKRNIRHHVAEGVALRLTVRDSGATVFVRLRPEAIERAVAAMREHNDEAGAALIETMRDDELLEVTRDS